jgi:hypothetical protein
LTIHGTPSKEVVEAFEEVVPHVEDEDLTLEEILLDLGRIFGFF